MRYIVELEPDVHLAPWPGDPGRTCVLDSAKKYETQAGAKIALGLTRRFRKFPEAKIVEVPERKAGRR